MYAEKAAFKLNERQNILFVQMVVLKRQQQAQVGEVVVIMHANMEKLFEEDQKLCELERHAKDLKVGASVSFRIVQGWANVCFPGSVNMW